MTADPRRPRALSGLAIGLLLVLLAGATFISIELVQRRKFAAAGEELDAALKEFKRKCPLPNGIWIKFSNSSEWAMTGGRVTEGEVRVLPPTDAAASIPGPLVCTVSLRQPRSIFLHSPRLWILWPMDRDRNVEQILDAILKARGIDYDRGVVVE